MNEEARIKSAFSTAEACRSVKLDYHHLTKIAQNVELGFDACGKTTHGTVIDARAHMKEHSYASLERLSCLQSVFLRLSNARCFMIHSIR